MFFNVSPALATQLPSLPKKLFSFAFLDASLSILPSAFSFGPSKTVFSTTVLPSVFLPFLIALIVLF